MARSAATVDPFAELDAPASASPARPGRVRRFWSAVWPQLAAIALGLFIWQVLVWLHWRPSYVLPAPEAVLARLVKDSTTPEFWGAVFTTLRRAAVGYGIALAIGTLFGIAIARARLLRAAFGALITGLQSMPSVAWFPLAILLFNLSESAILFVVILGAAPSIANGIVAGIDHIPPLTLRAGRVLGARGPAFYRYVILPAALPSLMAGFKQGWAFAWRSLMAGELLVIIGGQASVGVRLEFAREFSDAEELLASMLVVLLIGVLVDVVLFGRLDRGIRERRGLVEQTA
ncbi:MAG: sulfonate transport system permease protein [Chloroflexota bacterium]|jgi:NitT/TauT family transport system permease protein|nr:sulfonate transport system permease protein [Chloroflexota bacterium]